MSEGRIIVGVGVGMREVEYGALGVPFNRRGGLANGDYSATRHARTGTASSDDGLGRSGLTNTYLALLRSQGGQGPRPYKQSLGDIRTAHD